MCTVTIVPTFDHAGARCGIRMLCSRDESYTRPAARPPTEKLFKERTAVMPIDTPSGGTWIAANDAGLVMTLLNRNPGDMRGVTFPGKASRGRIIPSLLHVGSLAEACDAARGIDASKYPPFRLLIADLMEAVMVSGNDEGLTVQSQPITEPIMFTSSGLGDTLVAQPRQVLFGNWFGDDRLAWAQTQDTFHRHRWDDRPELSVNMAREDAATLSLTQIELNADNATLTYHPAPPDVAAEDHTLHLKLPRISRP